MRTINIRLAIALALFAAMGPRAIANNNALDSLHALLNKATQDSTRVRILTSIAREWMYTHGEMDSTIANARSAASRYDELPEAQAKILLHTRMKLYEYEGFALHQRGDNSEALERMQAGARLARELKEPVDEAGFYMYMAQVFRVMNDKANIVKYCRAALEILGPLGPSSDLALTHYSLAGYYMAEERWDSAEVFAWKALAFFRKDNDPMRQIASETLLLQVFHRTGQLDSAEVHLKAAEAIAKNVDYPPALTILYGMRGRIALQRGRYAEALADIDSSLALSERLGMPFDKYEINNLRGVALAANHRIDEAFAALDSSRAIVLRDMGFDKQRELTENRMAFEHEKEQAVAAAELRKQRLQKWAAVLIGVLGLLLAFVWYRSFQAKSKANHEIRLAQAQLIESEKAREAEQVRTRIARDIHDDIGASLTKIALLSGMAAQKSQDPAELAKTFARISEHTKTVSRALNDVVWAVDPQRDTHQGMLDHVRDLSQRLLGDNGIRFELDLRAERPDAPIAPALKRDLHLVLNECFNNILKYAHARLVRVRLDMRGSDYELRVDDDGVGFDRETVPGRSNGLKNMQARMEQHAGSLTITSAPGKGTALVAHGLLA